MGAELPLNVRAPLPRPNLRAVYDAVDQFIPRVHLRALQYRRDCTGQMRLLLVFRDNFPAFGGQGVVLAHLPFSARRHSDLIFPFFSS
jgi:phage baseplate assembly protein W